MEQAVVGEQSVGHITAALDLGELAHPLQVHRALGVEELLRITLEHERESHLDEQDRLQVWLGLDRLGEPRLQLTGTVVGDHVPLAVRTPARLGFADDHLAVARQPAQGRVHLPVRQRLAASEVLVVIALEVITVARLTVQQAEKGERDCHAAHYTSRVYV